MCEIYGGCDQVCHILKWFYLQNSIRVAAVSITVLGNIS